MNLFQQSRRRREAGDLAGRLEALEDYVDYLRDQGSYGFRQAGRRLDQLERGGDTSVRQ